MTNNAPSNFDLSLVTTDELVKEILSRTKFGFVGYVCHRSNVHFNHRGGLCSVLGLTRWAERELLSEALNSDRMVEPGD